MNSRHPVFPKRIALIFFVGIYCVAGFTAAQTSCNDTRADNLIDADHFTLRILEPASRAEWDARKKVIRETLLLRAGLWPEPERTPLNARIFDERKGDGFTVAKVYFESLPGFLATGNLYRPTKGSPPYPAIITPHGHWQYGRLQNGEAGSIPGRCIDFARMGFVVLSLDMVGYNDSFQLPHDPFKSVAQLKADVPQPFEERAMRADFDFPELELYGFNLGGVQLWNSIRGVDFLTSLPDVDPERIGATGASGGATQTIFLMTADDRIRVAAPVNIIGAAKHPGCGCENIPGLWLDTSTVEMAAAFSPKPLLLMSATEDPWTPKTPEREYPMIKRYYDLDSAGDMVKNVHINGGHNYNAETRAAVYEWFCAHLKSQFPPIKNPAAVSPELKSLGDLRVFPDRILPENALSGWDVMKNWKTSSERAFAALIPRSAGEYNVFVSTFSDKLSSVLTVPGMKKQQTSVRRGESRKGAGWISEEYNLGAIGSYECFEVDCISSGNSSSGTLLVACPESYGGLLSDGTEKPAPWAGELLGKNYRIVRVRGFASGQLSIPKKRWDSFNWPDAYNRDNTLNGVHDLVTAITFVRTTWPGAITVVGLGECGIPAAFACAVSGAAGRVVIDMNGSDPGYDGELVSLMPCGAIKRVGDFRTAALLLMQKKLVLCNPGSTFDREWCEKQAGSLGFGGNIEFHSQVSMDTLNELF